MVLVIITIVLIVVGFPLAALAAYAVEERTGTDSPTGAHPPEGRSSSGSARLPVEAT
jgi:hypothetical protein